MRMVSKIRKEQKYISKIICIYILATFILSIVGPVTFFEYEYWKVFLFILSVVFGIMVGTFFSKATFDIHKYDDFQYEESDYGLEIRIVNFTVIIALIIYVLLLIELIISRGVNFTNLMLSLSSVGDIYKNYLHLELTETNKLVQITTLLSVIPFIALAGGVYFFSDRRLNRKLFLSYAIVSIVEEVLRNGQLSFVVSWFLVIVVIISVQMIVNKIEKKHIKKKNKAKRNMVIFALVFIVIFGWFQNSRAETYNYSASKLSNNYFRYNDKHLIYSIFPEGVGDVVSYFCFYLSGGYYGLGKNLDTDFEWTYGYGNSKGLSSYLNQYLGLEDRYNNSYPVRTEQRTGYPSGQYWSTVFSWFAGDISFAGIPFFMAFLMIIYLRLYEDYRMKNNFFSLLWFIRLSEFFLFIPANNYIMQTRSNVIITLSLMVIWIMSHFRIRKGKMAFIMYKKDKI